MSGMPDPRRALLVAALGFLRYPPRTRPLAALHAWLDNCSGIGVVVGGMQGALHDLAAARCRQVSGLVPPEAQTAAWIALRHLRAVG
jgi:hypothetical protein